MSVRAPHPYLAVAVAGIAAVAVRIGFSALAWVFIYERRHVFDPFYGPLSVALTLTVVLVPCALAVWLSRLYEAPVGRRLAVCLGVGIVIASASLAADLGRELAISHWRHFPYWMWRMSARESVGIALGYAFVTGVLAGIVGLLRSKLSQPAEAS